MFYNHHRYYDPSTGRYVSYDPIGLAGGSFSGYDYVNGNPVSSIDPDGLTAIPMPVVPALPAVPAALPLVGAGLAGLKIGDLINPYVQPTIARVVDELFIPDPMQASAKPPKPRVNDPEANAEHEAYKRNYRAPPPPFKDPCDELRWRLKREEDLLKARQAWDAKWLPGRHAGMNGEIQSENAIRNIKEKMKQQGCECP